MENLSDEEIQRLIEEQLSRNELQAREEYEDAELYRLLFNELRNPLAGSGKNRLAERVISQIQATQERTEGVYDALFNCAVCLLIFGLTYAALCLTNTVLSSAIRQFFVSNKSVGFFIVLAYCAIQLLDEYIVKGQKLSY